MPKDSPTTTMRTIIPVSYTHLDVYKRQYLLSYLPTIHQETFTFGASYRHYNGRHVQSLILSHNYLNNRNLKYHGRVINKMSLAESVWGDNIDQADSLDFIYSQVKNLRKKLKQAEATIELKAVYGFGYKLSEL